MGPQSRPSVSHDPSSIVNEELKKILDLRTLRRRSKSSADSYSEVPAPTTKLEEWTLKAKLKWSKFKYWYNNTPTVDPRGVFKHVLDAVVLACITFNLILVPLESSILAMPPYRPRHEVIRGIDVTTTFLDLVFLLDVVVNFHTAVYLGGVMLKDKVVIAELYIRSWFLIDVASSLPIDWFFWAGGADLTGTHLRLLRCQRLLRVSTLIRLLSKWAASNILRLVKMLAGFVLSCHAMACGFSYVGYYLGGEEGEIVGSWIQQYQENMVAMGLDATEDTVTRHYSYSFYWTMTTITSTGYGDITPRTLAEVRYTIAVEIFGGIIFAAIFGNLAVLIQSLDKAYERYQKHVESVDEFIKTNKLKDELKLRVTSYFDYMWSREKGLDTEQLISKLPTGMRMDVYLHVYEGMIRQVPIFKDVERSFIKALCPFLQQQVVFMKDELMHAGDLGHEMFFLQKGQVQVVPPPPPELQGDLGHEMFFFLQKGQVQVLSEDGETEYARVKAVSFFGEISILLGTRRTATIRALENCEVIRLGKDDFDAAVAQFEGMRERLRATAEERLVSNMQKRASTALSVTVEDPTDEPETDLRGRSSNSLAVPPTPRSPMAPTGRVASVSVHEELALAQIRRGLPQTPRSADDSVNSDASSQHIEPAPKYKRQSSGWSITSSGIASAVKRAARRFSDVGGQGKNVDHLDKDGFTDLTEGSSEGGDSGSGKAPGGEGLTHASSRNSRGSNESFAMSHASHASHASGASGRQHLKSTPTFRIPGTDIVSSMPMETMDSLGMQRAESDDGSEGEGDEAASYGRSSEGATSAPSASFERPGPSGGESTFSRPLPSGGGEGGGERKGAGGGAGGSGGGRKNAPRVSFGEQGPPVPDRVFHAENEQERARPTRGASESVAPAARSPGSDRGGGVSAMMRRAIQKSTSMSQAPYSPAMPRFSREEDAEWATVPSPGPSLDDVPASPDENLFSSPLGKMDSGEFNVTGEDWGGNGDAGDAASDPVEIPRKGGSLRGSSWKGKRK